MGADAGCSLVLVVRHGGVAVQCSEPWGWEENVGLQDRRAAEHNPVPEGSRGPAETRVSVDSQTSVFCIGGDWKQGR